MIGILYSNKQGIRKQILENLLLAQKRAAKNGDTAAVIRLSKYIEKILNRGCYETIYFIPENEANNHNNPPQKG